VSSGYAIDMGEHMEDVRAVATPIRDYARNVVGALALVGPAYRFQAERIDKELSPLALKAGRDLSSRLGFDAGKREAS
jgi:DNA-binding IclR family transcriptional regulator